MREIVIGNPQQPAGRSPGTKKLTPAVVRRRLEELAYDLRWSWHQAAADLFRSLDPERWEAVGHNPVDLLRVLPPEHLERALADPEIAARLRVVPQDFSAYRRSRKTWMAAEHPRTSMTVAYLSAEFMVADCLPIFAGGLGAVAGEQLKSASALGVPIIGIGLLYRDTVHQWLDLDGRQQESWETEQPERLPATPARDKRGRQVVVRVPLPGRSLRARVWKVAMGRTALYLLDSDVAGNSVEDRSLTRRIYPSDPETRISQELLLGLGALRALAALGITADIVHLNEGHTAFAALQRTADTMASDGLTFAEARAAVAPGMLFTTHTPVAAGHDYFPAELAARYLAPVAADLDLPLDETLALGRYDPSDSNDSFCPTVLALRMCARRNGVSALHGDVTRAMWRGLWPRVPEREIPIEHVTNGIHYQSWLSPEMEDLLHRELGQQWRTTPGNPHMWRALLDVPDEELWAVHQAGRTRLVEYARDWLRLQSTRRGGSSKGLDNVLDPEVLTLSFVGRFVAYKRPTLFLTDPDRLARILDDPNRPVQLVFAGKAHPKDLAGKELLREVVEFARSSGLRHRIVFLEDFDVEMDRHLVQGVDVWLNTPRRPLEACGIAGMKAGANGGLNLSTIDGWWDEAWRQADPSAPPIGWSIGTDRDHSDVAEQDAADALSLYEQLENSIVPTFYDRGPDGVPHGWVAAMKTSMATLAPIWTSHRMVQDYTERIYLPQAAIAASFAADRSAKARGLAAFLAAMRAAWPAVRVRSVLASIGEAPGELVVEAAVELGAIDRGAVVVQLWVDHGDGGRAHPRPMRASRAMGGVHRYVATLRVEPGEREPVVAARVLPRHPDLLEPLDTGLVAWSG
jgi:starch phosphorylase